MLRLLRLRLRLWQPKAKSGEGWWLLRLLRLRLRRLWVTAWRQGDHGMRALKDECWPALAVETEAEARDVCW